MCGRGEDAISEIAVLLFGFLRFVVVRDTDQNRRRVTTQCRWKGSETFCRLRVMNLRGQEARMAAGLPTARNVSSRWLLEGPKCNPTQASGVKHGRSLVANPVVGRMGPGIRAEGLRFQRGTWTSEAVKSSRRRNTTVSCAGTSLLELEIRRFHLGPVTFSALSPTHSTATHGSLQRRTVPRSNTRIRGFVGFLCSRGSYPRHPDHPDTYQPRE